MTFATCICFSHSSELRTVVGSTVKFVAIKIIPYIHMVSGGDGAGTFNKTYNK